MSEEKRGGESFQKGEKVVYHPTGASNVSVGEIKRIITEPEAVGGRQTVRATEEEPRYVIENAKTRKETGYKAENIVEKADEE
jgi:hypothetical protein